MATYNGMAYLAEQVASILAQLGPADELVVVDDASSDGTVDWLRSQGDARVRVEVNESNLGHVATFGRALSMASGRVVFLSDQDDVWVPGRVVAMTAALQRADVVATRFEVFGKQVSGQASTLRHEDSGRRWANVLGIFQGRRSYFGSAMALRGDFLNAVLPIPSFMEAHDLWIALVGNVSGRVAHLEEPSLRRRVHGTNLTPDRRRGALAVMATRIRFVAAVLVAFGRRRGLRRP